MSGVDARCVFVAFVTEYRAPEHGLIGTDLSTINDNETAPIPGAIAMSRASAFSAICLLVCLLGVLTTYLFELRAGVHIAAVMLFAYVLRNLAQASGVARAFLAVAVLLIVTSGFTALTIADIVDGVERMAFLGALLAALGLLRVVAATDTHFARAGRALSSQPPSRRYLSMNVGGHLFTTLLNMGGLGLLVETVVTALRGQRHTMSSTVFAVRKRRIVAAIMRGFATIAFWTPFGIALNSLLLVFTDLHWIDIAPLGLLFAAVSLLFGWSLDRLERRRRPLQPAAAVVPSVPADRRSVLWVVAHIAGLGVLILLADTVLSASFQTALLLVVPLYALVWIFRLQGRTGTSALAASFTARAPGFVTEIGVFSMAGLVAPMIAALIPATALDPVFGAAGGSSILLALALMWTTLLISVVGVHPIISVIVLGELVLRNGGLSETAATLALLSGWAGAVTLSPFATTAAFVSRLVDESIWRVTWGWNTVYGLGVMLCYSLMLVAGLSFGLF